MKVTKPPYIPIGWIDSFFDLVRRVKLEKVDRGTIAQYGVCGLGNASKVVSALKFLNLIDENGKIMNENIKGFKLEGEQKIAEIKRIITHAYKELIDQINLSQAKKEDLINYFIGKYNFSVAQANQAVRMFLHLSQKAELELSTDLEQFLKPSKMGGLMGTRSKRKLSKSQIVTKKIARINEDFPKEITDLNGSILINIRGKGISMELSIKSLKDIKPNLEIISRILELNLVKE